MYQSELIQRSNQLTQLINGLEKSLQGFPQGSLRIQKKRKSLQYYHITQPLDTKGKYIKAQDKNFAFALAQGEYSRDFLREAKREKQAIDRYLRGMDGTPPEDVYDNLSIYRKDIVTPFIISDSEYARRWLEEEFEPNPFNSEEKTRQTNRGEWVRSKTEESLANMYYDLGIPYRYEAPLILNNGKTKYPDFTLLKLPERKLIYHEHMGMMEDEFYRQTNIQKIQDYAHNGIFCGKNLILTFDTDYAALNMKDIRSMAKEIFSTNRKYL